MQASITWWLPWLRDELVSSRLLCFAVALSREYHHRKSQNIKNAIPDVTWHSFNILFSISKFKLESTLTCIVEKQWRNCDICILDFDWCSFLHLLACCHCIYLTVCSCLYMDCVVVILIGQKMGRALCVTPTEMRLWWVIKLFYRLLYVYADRQMEERRRVPNTIWP